MAAMIGADVEQLRSLARSFDAAATALERDRMTVGDAIRIKAWIGPVAVRFRAEWDSAHSLKVSAAAARLRAAAATLKRNADEQEGASAAAGGGIGHAATTRNSLALKWESMTSAERAALPTNKLAVYGYSDSVPPSVRDEVNRMLLERYLADTSAPDYARKAVAYRQIEATLRAHPDARLLLLDPDAGSQVHAAIALGDVETADHVGVFVQGLQSRTDKANGISEPVGAAEHLRSQVDASLRSSGRANETSAMVVWMGYDSPQGGILNATMTQYGEAGSRGLAEFADGIRRANPNAHLTGVGHSYGSYVTGLAAQRTDAFDDVVIFGSPGIGADRASDLNISGHLYVLEGPRDLVADSARFGKDPDRIPDARVLATDSTTGHGSYLDDGSRSQRNIAGVIAGGSAAR